MNVTETPIDGYAHCTNARCPGYQQVEVPLVRTVTEHRYVDSGGDMPGIEKSFVRFRFANDADRHCPHCSTKDKKIHRDCGDEPRPSYDPLSGKDPMGLLSIKPGAALQDPKMIELENTNAALLKRLEALEKAAA